MKGKRASIVRQLKEPSQLVGQSKVVLSAQIADRLEADVARGTFNEKGKLPSQEELCARYTVSSSVLREAIHLLKARNIIYTINGVGSFIAERSVDPLKRLLLHYASGAHEAHDYSELLELRLAIETTCAEKIAAHSSPDVLKSLHQFQKIMESSLDRLQDFSDADLAFHSAIVDYSGNSLMKAIHASLRPTMRRFMDRTCTSRLDTERNCEEHGRIYAAVSSGSEGEASKAVRDHLLLAQRNFALWTAAPGSAKPKVDGPRTALRRSPSRASRR